MFSEIENEVANLIVRSLGLEDLRAEDIEPSAPLFRDGLGLDSIDALELALVFRQEYGIEIKADDEDNKQIFASLSALAGHVENYRVGVRV